ncbi:MAG: efflux RND transporter periplasmic adaptor subunit [Bacteroidota bacterium]
MPLLSPFAIRTSRWAAFVTLLFLAACSPPEDGDAAPDQDAPAEQTGPPAVQVQTQVAGSQTFEDYVQLTGAVEAVRDAMVSSEASGRIEYLAPLGSFVSRGGVIARFDADLAQAAYDAAKAAFDLAEDTFQRQEVLYADSIISAIEYRSVRAQRDQAQAQLRQAQKQLANSRLRSPFGGRVEAHFVETGELVAPGTPVVRVISTGEVKVAAGVPERYANDVARGAAAEVRFRGANNAIRTGQVSFVGSLINPASRTFPVEITLENRDGKLKPEMVADVAILREQLDNVIVVPQTAILRDERGPSVFIAVQQGDGNVAQRREVVLGPSFAGKTVVTSGLEPLDQVVTVGQANLTEGDQLQIVES